MKLRGRIDLNLNAPRIWDRIIFTEQGLGRCWRCNPTVHFHNAYPPTGSLVEIRVNRYLPEDLDDPQAGPDYFLSFDDMVAVS